MLTTFFSFAFLRCLFNIVLLFSLCKLWLLIHFIYHYAFHTIRMIAVGLYLSICILYPQYEPYNTSLLWAGPYAMSFIDIYLTVSS